ncbi:MAG: IS4 family transposase [Verrucomicrobia bacterium]|nr:IS4 family transposase [Verrucomicrobiota bacterium]
MAATLGRHVHPDVGPPPRGQTARAVDPTLDGAGTLAQHFLQLFGARLADSSWAERRARLPWEVFAELLRRALRPRATRRRQPEAFWRGWRLLALDATQFSLTNTPQINRSVQKAKSRRGRAAFAKLTVDVLLEVGLHNPLAAALGRQGQSEWALARGLLHQLPKGALLLADRLHGCAAFAAEALAACRRVGSHFLIRARSNIKATVVCRFKDGSRLVRLPVRQKGNPNHILQWIEVREIRVRVGRKGHRSQELRLWTSLLDWRVAAARELAGLYAQRWEHELYYRELKRSLRKSEVLQSHTPETAAQEIAALVLCSALVAAERSRAAAGQRPVLRVSFVKVLELLRPLWLTLALGEDLLSERQKEQLVKRFYAHMGRCVTSPRRSRSCPRAIRQPVSGWPRLLRNESIEGPLHFQLL